MNKDMKARWVARLRSGMDKQGRHYLRNDKNEMCCLGVLAEEAGIPCVFTPSRNGIVGRWEYRFPKTETSFAERSTTGIPYGFYGILGIDISVLMGLNDVQGKTFPEIADWIDENL